MGRNRQVLLVDADIDHRAAVKQALGGLEYAVVGEAHYGIEASRLAAELRPDIVLVHVEQPLARAYQTLQVLQAAAPHATPVAVSRRTDAATLERLMLSGARGFVASPAEAHTLDSVLRTARERHERWIEAVTDPDHTAPNALVAGTVVTVFGPKGGVGKTTLATNLALAISGQTEARVVLVDIDAYFGDVAMTLGITVERAMPDLLDQLSHGQQPDVHSYLVRHPSGLYVLPSRHTAGVSAPPDPDVVAGLLRSLAASFDFVVVDTPGVFGPQVAAALEESTTALLVTSADMTSVKDARMSLETLREEGFDSDRLKLVVNHATNANSVSDGDIALTVGEQVFCSIPHDRAVPVSTQRGEPLVLMEPRAQMAREVLRLAAALSMDGRVVEVEPEPALLGIFRRR